MDIMDIDKSYWRRIAGDQKKELERLYAQVARLRGALEAVMEWTYDDDATMNYFHEEVVPLVAAALSDTADDWLAEHDEEVRQNEREECAGWIRQFAELIDGIENIDNTKAKARHVLLLASDGIGANDEITDAWLKQHDGEARREERERTFSTVAEITEHYLGPKLNMKLSGEELGRRIAADLLEQFRAAIREGEDD